jgi:hypothetical protein
MIAKQDFVNFLMVMDFIREKLPGGFFIYTKNVRLPWSADRVGDNPVRITVHEPIVGDWSVSEFYPGKMVNRVIKSIDDFSEKYCSSSNRNETDDLTDMLHTMQEKHRKMFSVESGLEMILRNAQVEEEEVDSVFNEIVSLMKKAVSDPSFATEIMNIQPRQTEEDEQDQ